MQVYFTMIDWLEKLMLPCLFKALFNVSCPGCGVQRSFFLLLRGDVAGSIAMYWATMPIIAMVLYLFLHLRYRFRNGHRVLIFLYAFNGFLIICQYIYTISQHQ